MKKPRYLSVTRIAASMGASPLKVNPIIEDLGYQEKVPGGWAPTEKGKTICEMRVGTNAKGQSYKQLLWSEAILEEMTDLFPPSKADLAALEARIQKLEKAIGNVD